jgi:hypothetical protein
LLIPFCDLVSVLQVTVSVGVARALDPGERRPGSRLQAPDELVVARPALELVEQDEEQRGGVVGAVVRGLGHLPQGRQLAPPELVQDLARLGVAEVVEFLRLVGGEGLERGCRQPRLER